MLIINTITVSGLNAGTYNLKVKTISDGLHDDVTENVKFTVKKVTPKLTAKSKTFKVKAKTKKIISTLKSNINKAIKNTK